MKKIGLVFGGAIFLAAVLYACPPALAAEGEEKLSVEVTPSVLVPVVKGDREKFEEDNWTSRNTSGGLGSVSFSKSLNKEDSLEFEGRGIAGNNDYDAELHFFREGTGSLKLGFKEFRKYYDGTGGYYADFINSNFHPVELDNDLHLDIGKFEFEGVLAKENSPELSLAFEREFKRGSKSLVSWGPLANNSLTRYINPTYMNVDEAVNKLKFGVRHAFRDSEIEAKEIWERATNKIAKVNNQTTNLITGDTYNVRRKMENSDSDLYSTQVMYSKDWNKNLFMSLGLLYNHYTGGTLERITDTSQTSYNENHTDNPATVNQDAVTVMPNVSFAPLKDLLVGIGVKGSFETVNGEATYNRDYRTSSVDLRPDGIIDEYVNITTNTTKKKVSGNLQLKYTRIKNVVLYSGAETEKEFIRQFEMQDAFGPNASGSSSFSRKTNAVAHANNLTLGGKWYPVPKLSVTVEDKYKEKERDNRNEFLTGDVAVGIGGYRSYIDNFSLNSNTPLLKLSYKPFKWITGALGYIYDRGIYRIRTRRLDSYEVTKFTVETYSGEVTLAPADSFYCTLFYERRNDFTSTRANGAGGAAITAQQPDYTANVDVLGLNYNYAILKDTSIEGGYSLYFSDNYNSDYLRTGLPLGITNISQSASFGVKQALGKDRSVELKYGYKNYDEDSNNHVDDYEAHLLLASMKMAF